MSRQTLNRSRPSALWMAVVATGAVGASAAAPTWASDPAARTAFADAQALLNAQRPADAADRLDAAVAADPGYADAWFALALARRKAGQCDRAIPAYRRYAELRPGEAEPYYGLGLCLRERGDKAAAVTALESYLSLEHRPSSQKWIDNARATVSAWKRETGLVMPTTVSTGPSSPPAPPPTQPPTPTPPAVPPPTSLPTSPPGPSPAAGIYSDAQALRDRGEIEPAIARFQQAITVDPELMAARAALGELLLKLHRDEQAINVFQAAVRRNPSYPLTWYELGFALREVGRWPEAIDAFNAYIKLRPTDADPYYGLGRALQKLGRVAEARAAFQTYLALEKRPSEAHWIQQAQTALAELPAR